MAIERRKFLKAGLISGIGAIGAGSISYFALPGLKQTMITILKEDTKKLKIKEGIIEKFVDEALAGNIFGFTFAKIQMIRTYYFLANKALPLPYQYKYNHYRADIVGRFLLSTDFFIHKMDDTREILYIRVHNPYNFPCGNPFSSLYYPNV